MQERNRLTVAYLKARLSEYERKYDICKVCQHWDTAITDIPCNTCTPECRESMKASFKE